MLATNRKICSAVLSLDFNPWTAFLNYLPEKKLWIPMVGEAVPQGCKTQPRRGGLHLATRDTTANSLHSWASNLPARTSSAHSNRSRTARGADKPPPDVVAPAVAFLRMSPPRMPVPITRRASVVSPRSGEHSGVSTRITPLAPFVDGRPYRKTSRDIP